MPCCQHPPDRPAGMYGSPLWDGLPQPQATAWRPGRGAPEADLRTRAYPPAARPSARFTRTRPSSRVPRLACGRSPRHPRPRPPHIHVCRSSRAAVARDFRMPACNRPWRSRFTARAPGSCSALGHRPLQPPSRRSSRTRSSGPRAGTAAAPRTRPRSRRGSGDERGAHGDVWTTLRASRGCARVLLRRGRALHELQDARARVLERHVEIRMDPACRHHGITSSTCG